MTQPHKTIIEKDSHLKKICGLSDKFDTHYWLGEKQIINMQSQGNQNFHRPMANFKDLKKHIINNPQPNLEIIDTPPSQHHLQSDILKLDHPSLKMNRNICNKTVNESSSSRRLNLKEYIHLNSIEKKAKSKSFNKKSESGKFSTVASVQLSKKGDDLDIEKESKQSKEMNKITHEVLREEVQKKIEEGIKQLQDLSMFMKTEYSQKFNLKDSELFLFDILKGIDKTGQHLKEVGKKVEQYQGQNRLSNYKYYWHMNSRVLHSPAKMKNAFEFTISSFEALINADKNT